MFLLIVCNLFKLCEIKELESGDGGGDGDAVVVDVVVLYRAIVSCRASHVQMVKFFFYSYLNFRFKFFYYREIEFCLSIQDM